MINGVIDISHHNGQPYFSLCDTAGIVGVIHKATQGTLVIDPMLKDNRAKIGRAGLMFGTYHFGVAGNGKLQADFFLNVTKPKDDELVVLDYEPNYSQQKTMTLDQAREFVQRVIEMTGRAPGLYSGNLIKEQLLHKPKDLVLGKCWLWIAQYGPKPSNIPETWPTWTMWQYTDGVHGPAPHSVPGIGYCDRDQFNGDITGLIKLWNYKPKEL